MFKGYHHLLGVFDPYGNDPVYYLKSWGRACFLKVTIMTSLAIKSLCESSNPFQLPHQGILYTSVSQVSAFHSGNPVVSIDASIQPRKLCVV